MSTDIYNRLSAAFKKRYQSTLSDKAIQDKCNDFWNGLKLTHSVVADRHREAEKKICELLEAATRTSAGLLHYFARQQGPKSSAASTKPSEEPAAVVSVDTSVEPDASDDDEGPIPVGCRKGKSSKIVCSDDEEMAPGLSGASSSSSVKYNKPRQDVLKTEISVLESEISCLTQKRDAGIPEEGIDQNIKRKRHELAGKKKQLHNKVVKAKNMRDSRARQKSQLLQIKKADPSMLKSVREEPGRPRIEQDQPGLLAAISDIAMHGSSADDRRRSEALRACKTLDQLCEELHKRGFTVSRTSTYRRLIPRSSASYEGKRHVVTVPVKLCRAQSDQHRDHPDQHFCRATINSLEEVASVLGPAQVCFISQDDKAKVPIGKTAAKVQAPVLMHVSYKVRLSDHDFSVGERHLLTPSVYAAIEIKKDGMGKRDAVGYSGPTFVSLRSALHNNSNAATHAKDFETLMTLEDFKPFVQDRDGKIKPVLMISVDGGPDENPRYKRVISHAITHFKKYDLDGLFVFTNAPGRSAFNRVERRMAPLSRELSTLVLPHDHYGSHLNSDGKTNDKELELRNFQHAGETLAEIWSSMVIDGHNVVAKFVPPNEVLPNVEPVTAEWYSNHVRESQYLLQIIKCSSEACCSPMRSNLNNILFQRFLPAPFPYLQEPFCIPTPEEHTTERFPPFLMRQTLTLRPAYPRTKEIPYDFYCPSVKLHVKDRTCPNCGLYFASKESMNTHRKAWHGRSAPPQESRVTPLQVLSKRPGELLCVLSEDILEWVDVESVDDDYHADCEIDKSLSSAPIISNVSSWIAEGLPFEECTEEETDYY